MTGPAVNPIVSFVPVERIYSPCVNICSVDPDSGQCEGCHRTLDEIARWTSMTAAERDAVMAQLPDRAS